MIPKWGRVAETDVGTQPATRGGWPSFSLAGQLNLDCATLAAPGFGQPDLLEIDLLPAFCQKCKSWFFVERKAVRLPTIRPRARRDHGLTLVELVVATMILSILTMMALPLARVTIKREKEKQLRQALWEMRDAIDKYREAADRGSFQIKADSFGYPAALDDLVKGVDIGGKKVRFLRRIPVDPMTRTTEWGLRSMQDDPDSDSWGGQNVFDIYTKSQGEGLDGTKYKDW